MNYFAHGYRYLDNPYFLAGTAVPDWLSVVDRRMRVRSKQAQHAAKHSELRITAIAAGIVQHHHDDRWFHGTRAFAELQLEFTAQVRRVLDADDGFRPNLLAHMLVEILLDDTLIAERPARLDAYYAALDRIDPQFVADAVGAMAARRSDRLAAFIPMFCAERFLYDYATDEKLIMRLNHVMRRLKLSPLPDRFGEYLPEARRRVSQRRDALLGGGAGR